jgi:hypothetical protein
MYAWAQDHGNRLYAPTDTEFVLGECHEQELDTA